MTHRANAQSLTLDPHPDRLPSETESYIVLYRLATGLAEPGVCGCVDTDIPRGQSDAVPALDQQRRLLSLVLGYIVPEAGAGDLGAALMDRFGSLGAVLAAPEAALASASGHRNEVVSFLKALNGTIREVLQEPIRQRPILGSSKALEDYLRATLAHETVEQVRLLFLDNKNGLIKDELHARGTIDHTPLYPREVIRRVLDVDAKAVILVHNHPSGDPTPSTLDIDMTGQLASVLAQIDVTLHDHIIVGRSRCISLRRLGAFDPRGMLAAA